MMGAESMTAGEGGEETPPQLYLWQGEGEEGCDRRDGSTGPVLCAYGSL